jgi:hypothetical protein
MGSVMGSGAPVYSARARASQSITSTGSAQTSTIEAQGGEFITVTISGDPVYIAIAGAPNSAVVPREMVTSVKDFGPCQAGDKVSLINIV